jgi:hypothetical protein
MKLLVMLMYCVFASKFASGPTSCLFKKTGHYFCGTLDDVSVKPAKYPFRALGYCCTDDEITKNDVNCRAGSDYCTPVSG